MPPTIKIFKEDILNAALALIRKEGAGALNARRLAKEIGCSTQPIFRNYENMDELKVELYNTIEDYYNTRVFGDLTVPMTYEEIGTRYISFARDEREFFKVLFLSQKMQASDIRSIFSDSENQFLIQKVSQWLNIDVKHDENLVLNAWIYMHGLATIVATNDIPMKQEEIRSLLEFAANGFYKQEIGE